MVAVPAPTMVIVLPLIVATAVLLLVYVNAPVLVEVGAVMVNATSPTTFEGILKLVNVGVSKVEETVKVAVILPAEYVEVAA